MTSTHPVHRIAPRALGFLSLLLGVVSLFPPLTEIVGVMASEAHTASLPSQPTSPSRSASDSGQPTAAVWQHPATTSRPGSIAIGTDGQSPPAAPQGLSSRYGRLHIQREELLNSSQSYLLLTSSLLLAAAGLFLVHGSRSGVPLLGVYLAFQAGLLTVAHWGPEPFWNAISPETISFTSLLLKRNPLYLDLARRVILSVALGYPLVVLAVLVTPALRRAVTPAPKPLLE
jgi:hypothetical protein